MGGEEKAAPGARPAMTRRLLLTVGGLTLLAASAPDTATRTAALTSFREVRRPGHRLASPLSTEAPPPPEPPSSGPRQSGPRQSGPRRPGTNSVTSHRRRRVDDVPLTEIHDGHKAIALTIDDGPNPIYTPQVLRLLAKYKVTATFSMIGIEVRNYPAMAREVADAGHVIANHTWAHLNLPALSATQVVDQMNWATDEIHRATGRVPDLFRAPFGAWSPVVLRHCAQTGMAPLDWSVDPRDWSLPGVTSIVDNIMGNTRTGSIILEHDGGGNRSETVAALKIVIPRLLAAGYHFRTP
jgi:peptidoglycan/xylan/chitin deacetylase (PgdA/CDA1 family)